jgi:hypothetical protein
VACATHRGPDAAASDGGCGTRARHPTVAPLRRSARPTRYPGSAPAPSSAATAPRTTRGSGSSKNETRQRVCAASSLVLRWFGRFTAIPHRVGACLTHAPVPHERRWVDGMQRTGRHPRATTPVWRRQVRWWTGESCFGGLSSESFIGAPVGEYRHRLLGSAEADGAHGSLATAPHLHCVRSPTDWARQAGQAAGQGGHPRLSASDPCAGLGWADLPSSSSTPPGRGGGAAWVASQGIRTDRASRWRRSALVLRYSGGGLESNPFRSSVGRDVLFPWTPIVYGTGAGVRRGFFRLFLKTALDQALIRRSQ